MMRVSILIAGVAVAAAGCREGNVFQPPPPPTVTVQTPQLRDGVTIYRDYTGRTDASQTVEIRARVKGFLQTIDFEPSELVDAGKLLFTIEPESFEAAVASAEAALAQAEADRDLAVATLQRAETAFERGAVTDIEMLETKARADGAHAAVRAAEAELARARLELGYTRISSPIKGRVARELVTVGNLVGSGESTLLTTVLNDDPIHAYFDVSRDEVDAHLEQRSADQGRRPRIRARLQLADGRHYPQDGHIDFADPRVDPTTGSLQARAAFPNPDGRLIPGLFVRVRIPEEPRKAMLVPEIALQRDLSGFYLLIVNGEGTVERRDVELGPAVENDRIIEAGLAGDEQVIVRGLQRARPGIPVVAERAGEGEA